MNVKAMLNPLAGGYTWGWFVSLYVWRLWKVKGDLKLMVGTGV